MIENDLFILALLVGNLLLGFGISYYLANRRYKEYEEEITELKISIETRTSDLTKTETAYQDLNTTFKNQISELEKRVQQGLTLIEQYKVDMGKAVDSIQSLTSDNEEKNSTIDELKAENVTLNEVNDTLTNRAVETEARVQELLELSQTQEQENTNYKTRMKAMQDDLGYLSGIGPKVSSILRAAGINTFEKLASAELTRINEILTTANPNLLRLTDASSWSKQARLAADGEWEKLKLFQINLKGNN